MQTYPTLLWEDQYDTSLRDGLNKLGHRWALGINEYAHFQTILKVKKKVLKPCFHNYKQIKTTKIVFQNKIKN